eukprot:EG_transcript_606
MPPKEGYKFTNVNIIHRIQQQELRSHAIPLQATQGRFHVIKSKTGGENAIKSPQNLTSKGWDSPKMQTQDDKENIPMQLPVNQGASCIHVKDDDTKWCEEDGEMDFTAPLPGMEMSLTQSEDVRAAEIPLGSSSITVVPPLAPPAPLPAAEAVPTEELQGPGPSVDPKVSSPKHTSYVPPHMRARTQPTETKEPDASPKRQGCPQLEEPMPRHAHLPFGAVVAGPCTLLSAKEESQASTPEKEKSKEPSQPTFKLLLRPKPPPPTEQAEIVLQSAPTPDVNKQQGSLPPSREEPLQTQLTTCSNPKSLPKEPREKGSRACGNSSFSSGKPVHQSNKCEDDDDSWYWEQNVKHERDAKVWTVNAGKGGRPRDKSTPSKMHDSRGDRVAPGSGSGNVGRHPPADRHLEAPWEGRVLADSAQRKMKPVPSTAKERDRRSAREDHPARESRPRGPPDRGGVDDSEWYEYGDGPDVRGRNDNKGARRWIGDGERPGRGAEPEMDEYGYERDGPLKAALEAAERRRHRRPPPTATRVDPHDRDWEDWEDWGGYAGPGPGGPHRSAAPA